MPDITQSPWDRDAALKVVNGDGELLDDIIQIFLTDAPGILAALRQAVSDRDAARIASVSHKLIGSLGCLGLSHASEQARTVEDLGRSGAIDAAAEAAAAFEAEMTAIMSAMIGAPRP